ncbi:S-4TM family putative pore-forming effector [Actinoplanes regularis]|uniref:S-4TM family putative pore-forming effector n=1 Tax=Actinoplanes regularis TaxID=52697 RepID=UPI0025537727|nr:S-4TM family putative pore-forming effector [Actinoplanes regularis]
MAPNQALQRKVTITESELTALQAMSVLHQRVRTLSGLRLALSAALAGAGALVTITNWSAPWVTIAGAFWAGLYSIGISSWVDDQLVRAVRLQEMFEVELFDLKWNEAAAGPTVSIADASRLSKKFKGKNIADEWDEMPNLPKPFDSLARQLQNLGWGSRIRHRYADAVFAGATIWVVLGAVVGVIGGFTVSAIIAGWYIPSLGGLLLGVDTVRQQRAIAKERDRVFALAEKELLSAAKHPIDPLTVASLGTFSRQLQDVLFRTRCRAPRAPSRIFYLRYYKRDEGDFRAPVQQLLNALKATHPQTPPTAP